MLQYLLPRIAWRDLPAMLGVAGVGALLGGCYGIVHDQLTYSISAEYFTKMKFEQFRYADFGWGERVFVATIGLLATWWVGFLAGWFIARRLIPQQPRRQALRQIRQAFAWVIGCGLAAGVLGYGYGLWRGPAGDYSAWEWVLEACEITDRWAFVRVAYIHNASYAGGLIGLLLALVMVQPGKISAGESARDNLVNE